MRNQIRASLILLLVGIIQSASYGRERDYVTESTDIFTVQSVVIKPLPTPYDTGKFTIRCPSDTEGPKPISTFSNGLRNHILIPKLFFKKHPNLDSGFMVAHKTDSKGNLIYNYPAEQFSLEYELFSKVTNLNLKGAKPDLFKDLLALASHDPIYRLNLEVIISPHMDTQHNSLLIEHEIKVNYEALRETVG